MAFTTIQQPPALSGSGAKKMASIQIGTDPEFVLVDPKTGKPVSAINYLPPQSDPIQFPNGALLFHDNVLAEINVKPEADHYSFAASLTLAMQYAQQHISPLRLVAQPSAKYSQEDLEDPQARVFGCRPELDVWDVDARGRPKTVPPPVCIPENTLRTCGGHIHVGFLSDQDIEFSKRLEMVRRMDLFVGVFCALLESANPAAQERKRLYGRAGRARITSYGFEYRTPSNFWTSDPTVIRTIFLLTQRAIKHAPAPVPGDVKLGIDSGNKALLLDVWTRAVAGKFLDMDLSYLTSQAFEKYLDVEEEDEIKEISPFAKVSSKIELATPDEVYKGLFPHKSIAEQP